MLRKIISISVIPLSAVTQFYVIGTGVRLSTTIPINPVSVITKSVSLNVAIKSGDGGDLYTISLSAKVLHRTDAVLSAVRSGCLIQVETADGASYIYGTDQFPLRGSIVRKLAAMAKDFSGYTLSLSGSQLHDGLQLLE